MVCSIAINDENSIIASGSYNCIKLWDMKSGVELNTLKGISGYVQAICFNLYNSKKVLVSGGDDAKIRIWDIEEQYKIIR